MNRKRLCVCCYLIKEDSEFYFTRENVGVCSHCFRNYGIKIFHLFNRLQNDKTLEFYNKEYEKLINKT